jgi:hypothetical protein
MADENNTTATRSSARSFNPLQEGYTPVEKKGYTPSAPGADGPLPPAPAGSSGQTPVPSSVDPAPQNGGPPKP